MMDSEGFGLHWEGTFEDYVSLLVRTPRLAELHFNGSTTWSVVCTKNFFDGKEKIVRYNLTNPTFSPRDAIYGLDRPL